MLSCVSHESHKKLSTQLTDKQILCIRPPATTTCL